jgi:hypothetical protein
VYFYPAPAHEGGVLKKTESSCFLFLELAKREAIWYGGVVWKKEHVPVFTPDQ